MLEIFDFEQGTPEWHDSRCGIATASNFSQVLAKGAGKTRRSYLLKLVGERITGTIAETYQNEHMQRGIEQEAEARNAYIEKTFNDVLGCGFMRLDKKFGYSPDGLIGDDGLLEIKTKLPHLQADVLLSGEVPSDHVAQIQGGLFISGRKWLDFVSYCPKMPVFIKRVERDESYIAKLVEELNKFESEIVESVNKLEELK